ncbi:MAG: hypothetical protein HFG29_04105 [Eubacterium sp.]|nr:hypothetical protein [Eubacterium sp.]
MSGLDNIIKEIQASAKAEADAILQEAAQYCEEYMTGVREKVQKEVVQFQKKKELERNLYEEKTKSGAQFRERNAVLKIRQHSIDEAIKKAQEKLVNLPDAEYFDFLIKLFEKNVQSQNGVMYLSKKDTDRMPMDFKEKIEKTAEQMGGHITISSDRDSVNNGFILAYGEIEENCQIKALFDADIEKLKDIANQQLFG